jgi:hypothetical protein
MLSFAIKAPYADHRGAPLIDPQNEGKRAVMDSGPEI